MRLALVEPRRRGGYRPDRGASGRFGLAVETEWRRVSADVSPLASEACRSAQPASTQVRWSRPAETVWISPAIQHVGQPPSETMPSGASTSAAGPTLCVSASPAPISPKPIAPRVKWPATEALARGLLSRSGNFGSSVDSLCARYPESRAERLASAVQAGLHCGPTESQRLCRGLSR